MQHEIILRPSYSALKCTLARGEKLWTETGAMLAMDTGATMEGKMQGGLLQALKRTILTSESFFVTSITAKDDATEVYLAPRAVGDLEAIVLNNEEYVVQGGSFLASTDGIATDAKFTGWKGFVSGEGIFMIKAKGTGTMFASSFGGILAKDIPAGKQFIVDNGHIVAFPSSMQYEVRSAGGDMFNMITSGEGLACVFTGPGRVYLQTRNLRTFAETLNPFLPNRQQSQGKGMLGQIFG